MNLQLSKAVKPLIIWQCHESNISGANKFVIDYLELMSKDYQFHVIVPHEGSLTQRLRSVDIPFTKIKQYGWASVKKRDFFFWLRIKFRNYLAYRKTCLIIKRLSPSIYFTNTIVPYIGAKAAYKNKVKHVWWIHEFGEEDFNFKIGFGNLQCAYQSMSKWSNLIICNSNAIKSKFEKHLLNVPLHTNYQFIKWPHEISKVKLIKPYLMFGQIIESKGHLEVIRALGTLKKKSLKIYPIDIIGPCNDSNYHSLLINEVNNLGLNDYVKIKVGYFENVEIIPNYCYLIFASKCEAFGRVIIEAIKSGLKVIAKSAGSIPELINETNGIIYNDINELVDILSKEPVISNCKNKLAYSEDEEFEKLQSLITQLIN